MALTGIDARLLPSPLADVQLWCIDLDQPLPDAGRTVLSPDEQARAQRFRFARDRRRFEVGRVALRQLLASRLGTAPAAVVLSSIGHGKPVLAPVSGALHFNLSHSAGFALVAISPTAAVGIDVEGVGELADAAGLAQEHFSAAEHAEWLSLPQPQRARAFLRGWTRKEACLKAWGIGLSMSPRQVEVGIAPLPRWVAAPHPCLGGPLQLASLAVPDNDGLEAAVALGTAGGPGE